MAKIILETTTLTSTTKKGVNVVLRYRKVTKNTKTIRKVKKAPVTAGVAI